jgi:hypothetical protein
MKKIIIWSLVSVMIAGIAVDAFLWLRKPQIITLNDGTKLTLLGVTYGKHHVAPKIKAANGRARSVAGARIDSTNNTVVVWIEAQTKPNQYPNYQLLVYDKANTACVSAYARTQSQNVNGSMIQGFMLDAYPRWDSKMILRVMSYASGGRHTAKEFFVVSNPARASFPKWTAEPLPDTQSDGDLDVTLTRLNYGPRGFNNGSGATKNDPMTKWVEAAFRAEQKGVTATNWQPIRIETSDAAGNHAALNSWSNPRQNGESVMTYQWGLWPDESPWKLSVEFSKQSGFSDDEVWTVQNLPVSPGNQMEMWNNGIGNRRTPPAFAETILNGIHLKIFPAIQFTNQLGGNGDKPGGFRVQADQPLDRMQLKLVKATGDSGRDLPSYSGSSWGGSDRQFQMQNMRNSKTMTVTLALVKSRFVEFTVKPEKATAATTP